jgi:hypothetical protein
MNIKKHNIPMRGLIIFEGGLRSVYPASNPGPDSLSMYILSNNNKDDNCDDDDDGHDDDDDMIMMMI